MSLLSPLLWSFLPSQLASVLLPYATQLLPALFPPAPRGSPQYARNHRWVYTGLIVGYLGWTWTSGDSSDDWYALLGVPRWAEDDDLKKAFRTLSRRYHPDRSSDPDHENVFITLRRAYETLSNPTTRFAYDRFGPDIHAWGLDDARPESRTGEKKEVGIREWVLAGLMRSVGFYIFSGGIMAALAMMGTAREGSSYRLLLLLLLLTAELTLVLSPTPAPFTTAISALLPSLPPPLQYMLSPLFWPFRLLAHFSARSFMAEPQFLQIRTLHRLFTSLSVGISQLAGVWSARTPTAEEALTAATTMARAIEVDTVGEFRREVVPLLQSGTGHPLGVEAALKRGMQEALLDRSISSHPGIRPVWQAAAGRSMAHVMQYGTGSQAATRDVGEVELASRIPLPPSPPPSPRLLPTRG